MRNVDLDQFWPFPQRRFNAAQPGLMADDERDALDVYNQLARIEPDAFAAEANDANDLDATAYVYGSAAGEAYYIMPEGGESAPSPRQSVNIAAPAARTSSTSTLHRVAHGDTDEHVPHPPVLPEKSAQTDAAPRPPERSALAPAPTPPPLSGATPPPLGVAPLAKAIGEGARTKTSAPAAPTKTTTSAAPNTRRDWTPLVWGGLGFVAGMLAWHLVGFWSFMSNVVLNANDAHVTPAARATRAAAIAVRPQTKPTEQIALTQAVNSVAQVPAPKHAARLSGAAAAPALEQTASCLTLALNRLSGATAPAACNEQTVTALRDAGFNSRSDRFALKPRLQDANIWTGGTAVATTQKEVPPTAEPNIDYGTLNPVDLKLNMD